LKDHHDRRGQAGKQRFKHDSAKHAKSSAELLAGFGLRQQNNEGEELWDDQHGHRSGEHPGGENRILCGPLREERKALGEILGPDELRLQRDQDAKHQKRKPQRRCEIRPNTRQEVKS